MDQKSLKAKDEAESPLLFLLLRNYIFHIGGIYSEVKSFWRKIDSRFCWTALELRRSRCASCDLLPTTTSSICHCSHLHLCPLWRESVPDKEDLSKLFSGFVFFQQVHRFCKSSNWNYRLGGWKVLNRVFQEVFPRRIFPQIFSRRSFPQSFPRGFTKKVFKERFSKKVFKKARYDQKAKTNLTKWR